MAANASSNNNLEAKLNDLFTKNLPKLPDRGKKALVEWLPILSLVGGILTLLSAWSLWHWAHAVSNIVGYANAVCNAYGGYTGYSTCNAGVSRLSLWVWLDLVFLVIIGVLYLLAYSGLKAHKKQGWNYLYYGVWVNVANAVVSLLTDYNTGSHFVGALIGTAIGFYLLFQIRDAYVGTGNSGVKKPVAPTTPPKQ